MSVKRIELRVDAKARRYARIYSSFIDDEYQRKRANAAIIALFAYSSFLKKTSNAKVQNSMTLYRNPALCPLYEIADFYINGYHIDVRVTLDSEEVLIPKVHYDNDIVPDFYAVIKIDSELDTAEFAGIIDTKEVRPKPFDYYYYKTEASSFISNKEFIKRIQNEKEHHCDNEMRERFKEHYLGFIDNEISGEEKKELLQHLFKCHECRTEFCCFTGFEMVNCNAANYPDIFDDKTLDVIGAQDVDSEKYKGLEETIYTGKTAEKNTKNEQNEETAEPEYERQDIPPVYDDLSSLNKAKQKEKESDLVLIDEENEKEEFHKHNTEIKTNDNEDDEDSGSYDILDELFSHDSEDIFGMNEEEASENFDGPAEDDVLDAEEAKEKAAEAALLEKFKKDPYGFDINAAELEEITEGKENGIKDEKASNETSGEKSKSAEENISDIFKPEEYPKDFENQENEPAQESEIEEIKDEEEETSDNTAGETDIMDQMFVDGALEREIQEQQEVSYNKPSEIKPGAEENKTEKIPEKNENSVTDAEIKEESETGITEETEKSQEKTAEEKYGLKESNIKESSENEHGIILEETENESSDSDEETEEKAGLTGALKQQEDGASSVQMFDEYIESEAKSKNDADEDTDEDDDYYEDDDDDDEDDDGDEEMNGSKSSSLKKVLIILAIAAAVLAACTAGAYFYMKNKNAAPLEETAAVHMETPAETAGIPDASIENETEGVKKVLLNTDKDTLPGMPVSKVMPESEASMPGKNVINTESDMNRAITNALAKQKKPLAYLKGVNWFCSTELANDAAFKAYMQNLDNTLKQNLKNNLMGLTQVPEKNEITAKFAVDNNRNLRKIIITDSSNSEEIDKIVLQSINETFEGEKSPILSDSPLKADMYYFKVVIKL